MILSYQLYSSRNHGDLAKTCAMLKDNGYAAVEPFGGLFDNIAALTGAIGANQLLVPTTHVGLADLEADPQRFVDLAGALGIRTLYVPYLLPENRPDDGGGWREFGARLSAAGAPLRKAGFGFGWHNHDFEFVPCADGTIPLDAIFEGGTDLEWEADIAWIIRGRADPFASIKRYADRITAVHVKDIAPAGEKQNEDGWADPGTGTIDWPALHDALKSTPASVYVMEHDNPSDDERFAKTASEFFAGLGA